MTRLLVLSALTLTVFLYNCGGSEKPKGQSDPVPVIPDSIKNKPKLSVELYSWRLLTFTQDGIEQRLQGGDSVSITINFQFGEAFGSFGCNDFRIGCKVDSTGMVQFADNMSYSSRVCKGLMTQERMIKETIPQMTAYSLSADHRRLEMRSADGQRKLLYLATVVDTEENKAPEVKVLE